MFKRIAILSALMGVSMTANAAALVAGTVTQVSVSNGAIGVMITAAGGSVCPTGWFYAYDSDMTVSDVSRLLSAIFFAQSRGASVSLYSSSTAVCGTSHFVSITAQ